MRHARRAIAILTGFATGFIAAATVAYAAVAPTPGDPHEMPGFYNNYQDGALSASAAGQPLWQILAFVALGVLLVAAIVGLGYSLSPSQRSRPSPRSQTQLRS